MNDGTLRMRAKSQPWRWRARIWSAPSALPGRRSRRRSASPGAPPRSCRCRHPLAGAASCAAAAPYRRRSRRSPGAAPRSAQSRARLRPGRSARATRQSRGPWRDGGARGPTPPRAGWRTPRHRRAARAPARPAKDRARRSGNGPNGPPRPMPATRGARRAPGRSIRAGQGRGRVPPPLPAARSAGQDPRSAGRSRAFIGSSRLAASAIRAAPRSAGAWRGPRPIRSRPKAR